MSFIPGAFKQGATHLTGAIKKGAKWTQVRVCVCVCVYACI